MLPIKNEEETKEVDNITTKTKVTPSLNHNLTQTAEDKAEGKAIQENYITYSHVNDKIRKLFRQ